MFDKNTHFYKTTVILFFKKVIKLRSCVYLFNFQAIFINYIPSFRLCFQKYGHPTKKASREQLLPGSFPVMPALLILSHSFSPKIFSILFHFLCEATPGSAC